jgi:hypothetical protein
MSRESVTKFFEAVRTDEAVVERLRALSDDTVEFARVSAELGRARGFAFEPTDVRDVLNALVEKFLTELSDQDLSAVSGGGAVSAMPNCLAVGGRGGGSAGCTTALMMNSGYQWVWINGQLVMRQV